jgi:FKBP-type peptidyl-prolyl cis-trans isomerase SlyD
MNRGPKEFSVAKSKEVIANNKVVGFHYTLSNDKGEQLETSKDGEPMTYLHGAENIVPGLESQMTGHGVGDTFDAEVAAKDGYGERDPSAAQAVPRSSFPADMEIDVGAQFTAEAPDGSVMPVWITAVDDKVVHIDRNHPLAGETLRFAIEITSIRDATKEEVAHGHPHGPGGHHHH